MRLKVLIGCEFSGVVRDAFIALGHDAWSCDILDTEAPGPHLKMDIFEAIQKEKWDLLIAHPPCTHLAVSGARWWKDKLVEQAEAIEFVKKIMAANIPHLAVENPIGILSTKIRKPEQIIQPWQFGHGETKATCLWLKDLPKLLHTDIVTGREARIHRLPPTVDRWKLRSITYQGIAKAMAQQWSAYIIETAGAAQSPARAS